MRAPPATILSFIRHAPVAPAGRLFGRTDARADCSDSAGFAALNAKLGAPDARITSPALRCRQTAACLWPDHAPPNDPRLWEQDFGTWEGMAFTDLPDIGALDAGALAAHRPPQGESFADLHARVAPALRALALTHAGQHLALVVHAGVIRAALADALNTVASGLAFQIAPLSLTRIIASPQGDMSVSCVNWRPEHP